MECLKSFERWSRHQDLVKYVKVLESWDDKVCEEWDPPDENHLNCINWLNEEPLYNEQSQRIRELVSAGFHKVEVFLDLFNPFLNMYNDNINIRYDILTDDKLKDPTEILPLVLDRFKAQMESFDNFLPKERNLGLLRIDFNPIRESLIPNPKDCFTKLEKSLPPVVRVRIDKAREWTLNWTGKISGRVEEPDAFVAQF